MRKSDCIVKAEVTLTESQADYLLGWRTLLGQRIIHQGKPPRPPAPPPVDEPFDTGSDALNAALDTLRDWCEDPDDGDPGPFIGDVLDAAGRNPRETPKADSRGTPSAVDVTQDDIDTGNALRGTDEGQRDLTHPVSLSIARHYEDGPNVRMHGTRRAWTAEIGSLHNRPVNYVKLPDVAASWCDRWAARERVQPFTFYVHLPEA